METSLNLTYTENRKWQFKWVTAPFEGGGYVEVSYKTICYQLYYKHDEKLNEELKEKFLSSISNYCNDKINDPIAIYNKAQDLITKHRNLVADGSEPKGPFGLEMDEFQRIKIGPAYLERLGQDGEDGWAIHSIEVKDKENNAELFLKKIYSALHEIIIKNV